jgi:hypothetical protein
VISYRFGFKKVDAKVGTHFDLINAGMSGNDTDGLADTACLASALTMALRWLGVRQKEFLLPFPKRSCALKAVHHWHLQVQKDNVVCLGRKEQDRADRK